MKKGYLILFLLGVLTLGCKRSIDQLKLNNGKYFFNGSLASGLFQNNLDPQQPYDNYLDGGLVERQIFYFEGELLAETKYELIEPMEGMFGDESDVFKISHYETDDPMIFLQVISAIEVDDFESLVKMMISKGSTYLNGVESIILSRGQLEEELMRIDL